MYEVDNLKHQKELLEIYNKYKDDGYGYWNKIIEELNARFGYQNTRTWKSRLRRIESQQGGKIDIGDSNYVIYGDGTIEAQDIVNLTPKEKRSPEAVLAKMGYNIDEWTLEKLEISTWQQHTKDQTTKELYACKVRLKPKQPELDMEECMAQINNQIKGGIEPLQLPKLKENKELDNNKLMEKTPVELHFGKLSCKMNTGENYDYKIASDRFRNIIKETVNYQEHEKCGTLLVSIGGDFFNSDDENDMTSHRTQMHSDVRGNKMFIEGAKLWVEALTTYREKFNKIDVQFVPGNHDSNNAFRLFVVLMYAFANDTKINFIESYKSVQCYTFGECMIATTHGSKNVNRTIDSIVAEFSKEYGNTKFREIHFGHLHSEQELKERVGIIPRRLSAATGKDEWEYDERYNRTIQKQMLFTWNANTGVESIKMIPFERELDQPKKLRKTK